MKILDDVEVFEIMWKKWGGRIVALTLVGVFVVVCAVGVLSDDSKSTPSTLTPIQIKGDDATRIKDAYNSLITANREFQFALLQSKYNASVPKEFEFDIATFSWKPPAITAPTPSLPASKETKP